MSDGILFGDLNVSRETIERLEAYIGVLKKWNSSINLVAASTLHDAWKRHVLDSAQVFPFIPDGAVECVDLGSGAGFPGLVLAILSRESRPDLRVTLIESDRRKATFLREVIRVTGAPASVTTERVENWNGTADVVTARGFAPLVATLPFAERIVSPDGILLLHKGARYETELTDALRDWHMESETIASRVDPASVILKITAFRERRET